MSPRIDLLVVGHVNLDHEMQVPELPAPDRTVPVSARKLFLGGTACNLARWSSRLGVRTSLSAFVGTDFPREFRALLRSEGVKTSGIVVRPGTLTPACWIARDGAGRQSTIIDQGAMAGTGREPLPSLDQVAWVHLSTGEPEYLLRLARAARKQGVHISSDPAQEIHYRWSSRQLREMLRLSSLFFANQSEARKATEMLGLESPSDLLEVVPLAVVTRGGRGTRAYTRRGDVSCPALPVPRRLGVTGAGDAFRGAFYSGFLKGRPLKECLQRGARAGASVVGNPRALFLPPLSPRP